MSETDPTEAPTEAPTPKPKATPVFVILDAQNSTTYVKVGKVKAGSGRLAIKEYAEKQSLTSGKFVAIPETGFNVLNVGSETILKVG